MCVCLLILLFYDIKGEYSEITLQSQNVCGNDASLWIEILTIIIISCMLRTIMLQTVAGWSANTDSRVC